jgi:hypothetical protein
MAPSDRYYYGGEEYPLDLSQNIALVRQGYEGHWRAFFNKTTSFQIRPSFLKFEYILIGKFAKVFSLDPVQGYMIARFLVSILWFIFLYALVITLFKKQWQQILAFLFILFSASIYEGKDVAFVDVAVFDAQALFRFTYSMFHYLLGGLLAVASMFCFSRSLDKKESWQYWFIASCLLGCLSSFIYGPTTILIVGSMPFVILLRRGDYKRLLLLSAIYAGALVLPLLYVRYVVAIQLAQYNLNTYLEKLNPFHRTPVQYLFSLGVVYILSIVSLPQVLKTRNTFFLLSYGWNALHPISLYLFTDMLDLNPIRFYLIPYSVVFGILGVLGVKTIISLIPQQLKKTRAILVVCLAAAVFVPSLKTLYHSWKKFELCYCLHEISSYGYPSTDVMNGLWWLRDNTNNSDIVLSDMYAGTLIPAFAGNIVYTSWWFRLINTPEFHTSYYHIQRFFKGEYSEEEAKHFLVSNNISYVFYGFQERWHSPWGGEPTYASLQEVARFNNVVVYKVI